MSATSTIPAVPASTRKDAPPPTDLSAPARSFFDRTRWSIFSSIDPAAMSRKTEQGLVCPERQWRASA